jgi:hypothetical protein
MECRRACCISTKPNRNPAEDVRYRRNSGKHLLMLSFSHFDPVRTLDRPPSWVDANHFTARFACSWFREPVTRNRLLQTTRARMQTVRGW